MFIKTNQICDILRKCSWSLCIPKHHIILNSDINCIKNFNRFSCINYVTLNHNAPNTLFYNSNQSILYVNCLEFLHQNGKFIAVDSSKERVMEEENSGKRAKIESGTEENPITIDDSESSSESDSDVILDSSDGEEMNERIVNEILTKRRQWWFTRFGSKHIKRPLPGVDFTIMSYNILSQELLEQHIYLYRHCRDKYLNLEYRIRNILAEIKSFDVDIICFQELQEDHYTEIFKPHLEELGYLSVYKKKTGDKVDGCGIAYKKNVFSLVDSAGIEYFYSSAETLNKDNIGLIAMLKPKRAAEDVQLCVATTHLLFNPRRGDIKLSQLRVLLAEIDKYAYKSGTANYHPVILCGDMNSEPFSPLYNFLTCGKVYYQDMLSGNFSGQREGRNKGRPLSENTQVLNALGIGQNTQYEEILKSRIGKNSQCSKVCLDKSSSSRDSSDVQDLCSSSDENSLCAKQDFKNSSKCYSPNLLNPSQVNFSNTDKVGETVSDDKKQFHVEVNQKTSADIVTDTKEQPETSQTKEKRGCFFHPLNFISTYEHFTPDGAREVTTHNAKTNCTVDYIFYTVKSKQSFISPGKPIHKNVKEGKLKHVGSLGLLVSSDLRRIHGLPNSLLSSDHISLVSRFLLETL